MTRTGRTAFFLLALLLLPTGWARADVGFSFLSNTNPQFRFENLSDYPDYDFYLKYGHSPGNPFSAAYVTPVLLGTPTQLEGKGNRLTPVVLIAVPHGAPAPLSRLEGDWVTKAESGTLQSTPLNWDLGGTALYRIHIKENQLDAYLLGTEWLSRGTWVAVIAGVALCASLALGGLWLVRRLWSGGGAKQTA